MKRELKEVSGVATASVLLANEESRKKCIFCDNNHENATCEKAKTLSGDVIRKLIRENDCCFKCLKNGNTARKCRVKLECSKCSRHHSFLVCRDYFRHADVTRVGGVGETIGS